MAKRNSTRRKARKSKLIEIAGHHLTPAMHADYQCCIESRKETNPRRPILEIEEMALDDFLSGYRPSRRIKNQLVDITQEALDVAMAIGSMSNYTWYSKGTESIRSGACDLVKKLALDLYYASARLTAIASNVEAERTTKLQQWLAQDDNLAGIGHVSEVAHG